MIETRQTNSAEAKWTTVGVMKARIGSRYLTENRLAPIEAKTNIKPTRVAAAVPPRM